MPSSSCGVGVAPCDGCCCALGRGNVRPPGGQKRWRAAWKRERSGGWWSRTSRSAPPGTGSADAHTQAPSGGASSAPAAPLPSSVLAAADLHWMRTGAPERCEVSPNEGTRRQRGNGGFLLHVFCQQPCPRHQTSKVLLHILFGSLPVWTYPGGGASWTSPQGDVRGDRCGLMLPRR